MKKPPKPVPPPVIDRQALVAWLRHKGRAESDTADRITQHGAKSDVIGLHRASANTFFDLAAWIEGGMDVGILPQVSPELLLHLVESRS